MVASNQRRSVVLLLLCNLTLVLTVPLSADAQAPAVHPKHGSFVRGMALGMYSDIGRHQLEKKLDEVKALGASHISLVVSWSSADVRSTQIAPRKNYTTPDHVLLRMINRAHARGFKVFLFPILDIQKRKPLEWRGTLKPTDWEVWWKSYRTFIFHYATLAARSKVELFCVGSELVSTEKKRDRWEEIIARVRKIYSGKLVYSANWDHYTPVTFWDLVDVIGLTGYYKVANSKTAPESEMTRSWKAIRNNLEKWSGKVGRPIVFTELGYPSMDGSAVHPWDYTLSAPVDLEEQRRAISAFITAWKGSSRLVGVFYWDWYGEGGPTDKRYTPRGKPAEKVLRQWWGGQNE